MLRCLLPGLVGVFFFFRYSFWDVVGCLLAAGFLTIAVVGFLYRSMARFTAKREAVQERLRDMPRGDR